MTEITIVKKNDFHNVFVAGSKSYGARLAILSAVFGGRRVLKNIPKSTDFDFLIDALSVCGISIKKIGDEIHIDGKFSLEKQSDDFIELHTGDGGTTNRFLLALLARSGQKYRLIADPAFLQRPNQALYDFLRFHGVKLDIFNDKIELQGPINFSQNTLNITTKESTQYLSALALAFADQNKQLPIEVVGASGYVDITKKLINDFLRGKTQFLIPTDMSSLTYPLALSFFKSRIQICNVILDPMQPDYLFIDLFKDYLQIEEEVVCAKKMKVLNAFTVDVSKAPDLAVVLSFIAGRAEGISVLRNVSILKNKESDRLFEIQRLLSLFHIDHKYDENLDNLFITGSKLVLSTPVEYNAPKDHRLIMTAFLFMQINNGGTIKNYHHVNKSFKDFFTQWE